MRSKSNIPMFQYSNALGLLKQEELDYYLVATRTKQEGFLWKTAKKFSRRSFNCGLNS